MRKIKFRLFGKNSKEFLGPENPGLSLKELQNVCDMDVWHVMQFTGLEDVNGVEIYEHDIAKISVDGHKPINAKIIFECGSFWLYSIDLPSVFDSDTDGMVRLSTLCLELDGFELNQLHQLEVIGNIHQNPELLGGVTNG